MKKKICVFLILIAILLLPVPSLANETDVTAYVRPRGRLVVEIIRMPGLADILLPDEETWGHAILTLDDFDKLEDGIDISVRITASPADTPRQFKQYEARGYHALYSTDISIIKEVGNDSQNIEQTAAPLSLYFEVPGLEERDYGVIRHHGTDMSVLESKKEIQGYTGVKNSLFSVFTVYERASSESLKTGDSGRPVQYILLCMAAVIAVIYLVVRHLPSSLPDG